MFASCTVEPRPPNKQTADSLPESLAQLKPVGIVCCEAVTATVVSQAPGLTPSQALADTHTPRPVTPHMHTRHCACHDFCVPQGAGEKWGFQVVASPAQSPGPPPPFPITHLVACLTPRPSPIPCPHHALTCVCAHPHTRTHPPSRHHPLPHPPNTGTPGSLGASFGVGFRDLKSPLACSCDVTLCSLF